MKSTTTVVRILLGLMNHGLRAQRLPAFYPMQQFPPPTINFFGALAATGYMIRTIFFGQLIDGVLLLTGVEVPLALGILAPFVVNILLFQLFLATGGLAIAFVVVAIGSLSGVAVSGRFCPTVQLECTLLNALVFSTSVLRLQSSPAMGECPLGRCRHDFLLHGFERNV